MLAEPACGQRPERPNPTVGSVERLDPRFDAIVPPGAEIEVLAMGFAWSEGPVWVATDEGGLPANCLLFSDIPRNRVNRWQAGKGIEVFLEPAGFTGPVGYGRESGSNGLALDQEGRLILCEHGDRRVSRLERGGGRRTLADAYQGKRLNSPNDLVVHSTGTIYFTDPPYGLPKNWDDPLRELDICGIYRLGPDGGLSLECGTMTRPNGIGLSPDEKTLYVAQSDPAAPIWREFKVRDDGSLDDGRVFFDAKTLPPDRPACPMAWQWAGRARFSPPAPAGCLCSRPTALTSAHCSPAAPPPTAPWARTARRCSLRLSPCSAAFDSATDVGGHADATGIRVGDPAGILAC